MARYVETVYARRYLNDTIERDLDQRFDNATTIERWVVAPYFYGLQYYERTAASPSALPEVVATPPASTEDLLHRNPPDGAPLAVNASDLGPWHVDQDGATWGEAATRVVLRDELNETRSVAAAAGWANDSYYALGRDDGNVTGYVWTHRWDSPAEATEFATAMENFLDRRRTETERYRFRVERLTPETTAVIAGRGGFVGNATATADGNATVAVSVSS